MLPNSSSLVDTHCHLDLYSDPHATISRAERRGVYTIGVTNTPSVFRRLMGLVGSAKFIRPALGLHPELAHERIGELPLFKELLHQTPYVGEVGLDYTTTNPDTRRTQQTALTAIVEWCQAAGGKIVTVHSRRAADDVIDLFGSFKGTFILHWYSGSARSLERALINGAYVSVNPAMVRSERGRALLKRVPKERVLTETDGPFVQVDGRPAEPEDVLTAIAGLASIWATSDEEAKAVVYLNFSHLRQESSP